MFPRSAPTGAVTFKNSAGHSHPTASPQIGDHRLADIDRQRQPVLPVALPRIRISPRRQSTSSKLDRGDLTDAQPKPVNNTKIA